MTVEIALMLGLLIAGALLFGFELLAVDVVTLLLLAVLVISGILTPVEAFSGFANELIVILASIFVISGALARSGVMEWLGRFLYRETGQHEGRSVLSLMGIGALASAFISNTSATAILMPAALEMARRAKKSASRYLMPLAFATILGGTCTLIGTSTNIAGSSLISRLGLEPYSLFEFAKIGVVLAVIGLAYLALIGRRLVPPRRAVDRTESYGIQAYLSELIVPDGSAAVGKAFHELDLEKAGVRPLAVMREGKRLAATAHRKLQADDRVIVKADRKALLEMLDRKDFRPEAERTLTEKELVEDHITLAEAVVLPQSRLTGKTLRQMSFFQRFGVIVLAIYRRGQAYPARLDRMTLKVGDVLLLQGAKTQLEQLRSNPDLWGLTPVSSAISTRQGLYVLASLSGAIVLGTTGVLPLSIAFLLAALSLVLVRGITMDEAYSFVEWRLIVLIAGMTSFGLAMQKTGTAEYLAAGLIEITTPLGMHATLAAFALITVLLTQPMSNAAAALVVLPIAVASAGVLNVDPRPFAVLVTLSASLSFITPFEPASLLVYGTGNYRFGDFFKVGLPMTIGMIPILVFAVPILWPLHG